MSLFIYEVLMRLFMTFVSSLLSTPFVKLLAFRIGAYDAPGEQRINTKSIPTAGGLAIYIALVSSCLLIFRSIIPQDCIWPIILADGMVVLTGLIDDIEEATPMRKTIDILLVALVIYFVAGIRIDFMTLPVVGVIDLRWSSLPLTLLWILAITNAVDLISGLDGLTSGVSIIGLATIGITGYSFPRTKIIYIPIVVFILVASIVKFFPYNFYPAKIFPGDTGVLFLGFMIAVMSLRGLKDTTFITVITPIMILGVPITDTAYAIIRRLLNKKPISSAGRMHLHHHLLPLSFTHKGAVMTIYTLALVFSFVSLLFSYSSTVTSILLIIFCLIGLELLIGLIGLVGEGHQPLIYLLRILGSREYRQEQMKKRLGKHSKRG